MNPQAIQKKPLAIEGVALLPIQADLRGLCQEGYLE